MARNSDQVIMMTIGRRYVLYVYNINIEGLSVYGRASINCDPLPRLCTCQLEAGFIPDFALSVKLAKSIIVAVLRVI